MWRRGAQRRLKDARDARSRLAGLLGTLAGLGRGTSGLGKFFSGDPSLNQRSFLFVWLMTIICAIYVGLCANSFLQARKQRKLAEDQ